MSSKEVTLLSTLAEYRVLGISQLSAIFSVSQQMMRRRITALSKTGFVDVTRQPRGVSAGRPENVVYLREFGANTLRDQGVLDPTIAPDIFTKIDFHTLGHQLLINWFRIHLNLLSQHRPALITSFLSPTKCHDWYEAGISANGQAGVIPDGIFSITEEKQGRSLLFFLEVDMATETLSSSNPQTKDIRKKVISYQQIFKDNDFKRLEEVLGGKFRGFRTLFVAATQPRLDQLCRLVRALPGTNFIWLTNSEWMFQRGVSAPIWVAGGNSEAGLRSILGATLAFDCPLPASR